METVIVEAAENMAALQFALFFFLFFFNSVNTDDIEAEVKQAANVSIEV